MSQTPDCRVKSFVANCYSFANCLFLEGTWADINWYICVALTTRDMKSLGVKEFDAELAPGCPKFSRYLTLHGLSDSCALSLSSITHGFTLSWIQPMAVSNPTVGVEVEEVTLIEG